MTPEQREYRDAMVVYLRDGASRMSSKLRDTLERCSAERNAQLRSMGTATGADGGYLMPAQWTDGARIKLEQDWLYREATVVDSAEKYHGVTMATLPTVQGVAQAGDGSVTATESTPKVFPFWLSGADPNQVYGPLTLRDVPAFVRVSRRLFEDALTVASLDELLTAAFAMAIAGWMHTGLITGTHSSTTIMGLKASAGFDSTRIIAPASATQVRWPDLAKMIEALGGGYVDGAKWLFNPRAFGEFAGNSAGTVAGTTVAGIPYSFHRSLNAPANGEQWTVALFRPRNFVIAHNINGMSVQRLDERYAPDGQVAFQINYRVDACIDSHNAFSMLRST